MFSVRDLTLAWNRIATGRNLQHKSYFRPLYASYAIALRPNLADLAKRLRLGSYRPEKPTRVFYPKASGLQRPITLLCIEDQLVLQALANEFARRLKRRRAAVELTSVFSNVLYPEKDTIFFVRDWRETYRVFTQQIRALYGAGYRWIAEFDLAAFYDTISHERLLKTAFPRGGLRELEPTIRGWLSVWTAELASTSHGHGIPQGPVASDFLAECFLLPIDETLRKVGRYLRYVDDVRLFGRSEREVRHAAVELEVLCRNRGLIPQSKKFQIRRATSLADACGGLPSLEPAAGPPGEAVERLAVDDALRELRRSVAGRPRRITDRTRARFVIYRAPASRRILRYVTALIPRHPEHADVFFTYLEQFTRSVGVIRACRTLLRESPYEFLQGEAWRTLARMMTPAEMVVVLEEAVAVAKRKGSPFAATLGACILLCRAEQVGLGKYARFVGFQQRALIQALVAPMLGVDRFARGDVVGRMLKRSTIEPGLAVVEPLVRLRVPVDTVADSSALPSQVQNVFKAVGLLPGSPRAAEPISELLQETLDVPHWPNWRALLGSEYAHACQLLAQAAPIFRSARSLWLIHQNSFNHAAVLAVQKWLHRGGLPGCVSLINSKGRMVEYGALVQAGNPFSRAYPAMTEGFRDANRRRNSVPSAHPYESRTGVRSRPLRSSEQRAIVIKLRRSFAEIGKLIT